MACYINQLEAKPPVAEPKPPVKSAPQDPDGFAGPAAEPLQWVHDPESFEAFVYVPPHATGPFPLLLYLHGAGEMSGDLDGIISDGATGTPPVSLARGTALSELTDNFIVAAPHSRMGWRPREVVRFVDFLLRPGSGFDIDSSRLFITGHSMGGHGALAAAALKPHRFAATVPVAPAGDVNVDSLVGVPVWAFHGRNDVVVPSEVSARLAEGLMKAGALAEDVRLTLYEAAPAPPGWPNYVGHASTMPAYSDPELYRWLLTKRLSEVPRRTRVSMNSMAVGGTSPEL